MKERTVLDIDRIIQVLQRRCNSLGVTLEWSKHASTAFTNGRKITLPAIYAPVSKEAMDKLYGFVIHEAGHHGRPEAFDILNAAKPPSALAAMYNIVEDDGMERDVATAYQGDAKALGEQNNVVLRELADTWAEQAWPSYLTEQDVAPLAICGIGQLSRMEWDGMSTGSRVHFMNGMHPVAKDLLDKLVTEGWVKKFQGTKDAHDTWDVSVDLYKRIFPEADNEQVEEVRAKGHAMRPKGNEKGEAESSDKNGDDASAMGDGDELGEGKDDTKLPSGEGKVISWKDAVLSEHNEWEPKKDGARAGNIGIDWTDYQSGKVSLMPQHLINVMDCRTTQFSPENKNAWQGAGTPESFMPDNTQSRAFANSIRRFIQAQTRIKVTTERYHGRLDKRSLIKLALPPIDGGEWNKRLFYRMDKAPGLNTAIHVLTDWSGSMQGQKMVHAADASGRLVHTFDRVLRVPVQLAAFTNARSQCDIGLIKAFKDRSMSPLDIATGFSRFYKFSSANNDADAVMWAYNQLMKRDEDRKILIVLSDGCPAGSWAGSGSSNLSHVTATIQNEGKVELYGVGIMSEAVRTYYKNCKVLNDPSEINRTLFEIIKEGVK